MDFWYPRRAHYHRHNLCCVVVILVTKVYTSLSLYWSVRLPFWLCFLFVRFIVITSSFYSDMRIRRRQHSNDAVNSTISLRASVFLCIVNDSFCGSRCCCCWNRGCLVFLLRTNLIHLPSCVFLNFFYCTWFRVIIFSFFILSNTTRRCWWWRYPRSWRSNGGAN